MTEQPIGRRHNQRVVIAIILCLLALMPSGQTFALKKTNQEEARGRLALGRLYQFVNLHGPDASSEESFTINFRRTALDTDVEGTAFVVIGKGTISVRVQVHDIPVPTQWNQVQYSLWVDLQNYGYKLHLGDLPIEPDSNVENDNLTQHARNSDGSSTSIAKVIRGSSDSFFHSAKIPADAVFGGLIVTAEPPRYEAIINEPLNPVLIARADEGDIEFGSLNERAIRTTAPVYPGLARKYGISGSVKVFVEIDDSGAVAKVGKSNGPAILAQSAATTVRKWTFRPVLVTGKPVRVKGFIVIRFTLK